MDCSVGIGHNEAIVRNLDDVSQDGLHEFVVVGVGVVKVERAFHRLGRLSWSEISVERVLAQDFNLFLLCVHL